MSSVFVDPRIGREFQSAAEVESLPVGAVVVDADGDAWQRVASGRWHGVCMGSEMPQSSSALASGSAPLLLLWVAPGSELKSESEFEAVSAR